MASKLSFALAIGSVLLAATILELVGPSVNAATAAQILLLVILLNARFCGTRPALAASALAVADLFRYFRTPQGFAFGDPNDLAALSAFIIMAAVGSELASRAENRARESEQLYRQLQAAFERESEAEASRRNERLKATLLDAMAHNLRTPLTSIKAAVTAMIRSLNQSSTAFTIDEQQELLVVIDEETDRLNRFVGGLVATEDLALAQAATVRSIELKAIVVAAVARAEALTREHRVIVRLADGLPPVAVDSATATEVLYMLLDNASKYSPPATTICVDASSYDPHSVSLRVIDEGPGIPVEFRDRVFDRFFRIPNRESHDPARPGVGVGLALAKRLIETQGGRIWIEGGESPRGTVVVVLLPAATLVIRTDEKPAELLNRKIGRSVRKIGETDRASLT